ncbi:AER138Cp [Eremothecium gossypii ATCC 10895]|uniref:FACT complex subunit POB3 n=1 Tax=Eremothecium gossypii (strain ATCC 10895 / CBS 109.51 / FGSC 9923 / NRRL Y-1056) TaxID=284811 RepID=POB3_EREGS|nr:AER138Cp [Eremothecium gossypii ATCC 10895]Q756X6.1 RecName: Full=FACT complex subunit POB3; AltName: Full=Facilitates chromatin transcription complex subunit POB3 [Eremothecium gossypii ATCC 10895]AAS52821.1 AER138Cp [Eremothecium gossypii ATCC 10895]AEY97127.1 FAER138Cp [Eremothecium gossypii FDAG1]
MSTDFDRIYYNQSKVSGRFRLGEGGLGWKASATGGSAAMQNNEPILLTADELASVQWSRGCRGYELKINTKNKGVVQLDGFSQEDFTLLKNDLQRRFNVQLEHKDHSLRGWNWGTTDLTRNELIFSLNGKPTFEIPYSHISNTNLTSKNEVALEFDLQKDGYNPAGDELVEMRLYVPGVVTQEDRHSSPAEDADVDMEKDNKEEKSIAEAFYEELRAKAEIGEVSGDAIISFQDVFFTTPRGRYDIDIYKNSIRLRGKTYEYKLQHRQIQRIFSLPKADDIHHLMVLSIEPPLRQGQTTYPYLVLQFQKDEETEVQLNVEDDEFERLYKDKLKKQYDAKTHVVLSHVLKGLTDTRVVVPGEYKSKHEQCAVSCSFKANEGHLYPLDNAFMFLTKPTLYIPFQDVSSVNISRAGQATTSSRTFDLEVVLRSNRGSTTFANISKEEQQILESFLKSKNVRVKNEEKETQQRLQTALGSDSEDEDVNMGSAAEDDESVDEDFQAESEDDDVAEEFDSDAGVSESETEAADGADTEDRPSKKAKLA